jgi:hypothetical protein
MNKNLVPESLIHLPSGQSVHPCRMIIKDGTLMWKDAITYFVPSDQAHEAHIIKTAQRLEDLHTWVSEGLDCWEGFKISSWYNPLDPLLYQGIAVFFQHRSKPIDEVITILTPHIYEHETLDSTDRLIFFKRC